MNKYKFIIGLDPSGAYWEGKGTTGYSLFNADDNTFIELGEIQARGQVNAEAYWHKHILLLESLIYTKKGNRQNNIIVIIEDYLLYAEKAQNQINSRMETCQLIGIIKDWCFMHNIPYIMQTAGLVKKRWTDEILHFKGWLKKTSGGRYEVSGHTRDSMRHVVHYATFKNKEG